MKIQAWMVAGVLFAPFPAGAWDSFTEANFNNAAHFRSYRQICREKGAVDLESAYIKSAIEGSGEDRKEVERKVSEMAAQRVEEVKGQVSAYCQKVKKSIPERRSLLSRNDPSKNIGVPGEVINNAYSDCKAAVPVQNSEFHRNLYTKCVQSQVDIWITQERLRRAQQ